jgi:hypothetical protein
MRFSNRKFWIDSAIKSAHCSGDERARNNKTYQRDRLHLRPSNGLLNRIFYPGS